MAISQTSTIVVKVLLEKNNHWLFLVQTGKNEGRFSLPGGKVELNETPIDALIRECWEETGIKIKKESLTLFHVLYRIKDSNRSETCFYYKSTEWQGLPTVKEKRKFKSIEWCIKDKPPLRSSPHTHQVLQLMKEEVLYSEFKDKKPRRQGI